ncbi:MAG: TraR/DksA family transcriptional regulator [Bacteroidetes bacterium]|nr:TraR/DksA family transcriptional regulator [Bacteroidota bacterium]
MSDQNHTRYSDEELEEFKQLIEQKLARAESESARIKERLEELEEQADSDRGDYIDDSSNAYDVEQLNTLEYRQRKHIQDLKNALVRIRNRTYGVCVITGQLIDKRRLKAVLTTTKSLEGKEMMASGQANPVSPTREEEMTKKKVNASEKKIISRVIKKSGTTPKPAPKQDDYEDDYDDDLEVDSIDDGEVDNLDDLVHPDYEKDDD